MNLEPEVVAQLQAMDPSAVAGLDIVELRKALLEASDRNFEIFSLEGPEVHAIRDHQVPVEGGEILVRTYHPTADASVLPGHVYVHGGGWSIGTVEEKFIDASARFRAAGSNCVVAAVEYRLAPEHPFPVPVHDVVAAIRWVRDNAAELGIDAGVLTVGGASAGANLACAAVLAAGDLGLTALVLEVPALDMSGESAKKGIENGAFEVSVEPLLRGTLMQLDLLRAGYLPDPAQYRSPLASPIYAEDLSGFPETHILTAEIDVLRPEGERFAELLEKAGVTVSVTRYPGALHMSSMLTKTWPTAKRWQDDCLAILNDVHAPARSADA